MEKRDAAWEAFLQTKCLDEQTFAARRQLITDWLRRPEASDSSPPSEELAEAIKRAQNTIIQFEHNCQRIKDAVQRQGST